MAFDIPHRSGAVLHHSETATDLPSAIAERLDRDEGGKPRADLAGTDLADADLAGTDLADADLAGTDLAGTDLAGANLAGANLADANLADANLAGAYLADADLAGANLADANLADANLAGAYLAGAYLAGAYLADAYLAGANLADANLAGANLAGAYLAGAYLADARYDSRTRFPEGFDPAARGMALVADGAEPPAQDPAAPREPRVKLTAAERAKRFRERHPEVPVVEQLDAKILERLNNGCGLNMSAWHSCATTHCRAGWAITLAGDAGADLERRHGPQHAGAMIYRASTGKVPHFFAGDKHALEDIQRCAAEQLAASEQQPTV